MIMYAINFNLMRVDCLKISMHSTIDFDLDKQTNVLYQLSLRKIID